MIARIADLIVDIPEIESLVSNSLHYKCGEFKQVDMKINEALFCPEHWPTLGYDDMVYMESGTQFYAKLLRFGGMMLHSSAICLNGRAYLFSGPCGRGKSTHTGLWQEVFGDAAVIFNDDKPALRFMDGRWYAYGTPWSGKNHINVNTKVPLAGICFLEKAKENHIRRLDAFEALQRILPQTTYRLGLKTTLDFLLSNIDNLVNRVPVFEFANLPIPESAMLSHETMLHAAEEMGL